MQYGYFDDAQREYVITRPDTPRPWCNYLGGHSFGAVLTNNAAGYTFYKSAAQGRLTRFRFNSPPGTFPGKYLYLRDPAEGDFWSASWMPVGKPLDQFASECRHGTGYTRFLATYAGIASDMACFIPLGGLVEIWDVALRNRSAQPRRVQAFAFVEPQCNWNALDDATNLQYTQFITQTGAVDGMLDLGSNVNMPEDPANFQNKDQARHSFLAAAGLAPSGFDCDLAAFLGPYGSYAAPQAVAAGACTGSTCAGDLPCLALQFDLELQPGETRRFAVLFGVGQAGREGAAARAAYASPASRDAALAAVRAHWHSRLENLHAETPDAAFNSMLNTWAPYNNLMTFYWSRTASLVYAGERDGLGYRDSVQDLVGASALVPDEAAPLLELLLTGQCASGGAMPVVKPFAHRPGHESPPAQYRSDDTLWLFNAVPEYVKETGDLALLGRTLPYADQGAATGLGHLRRALEFSLERRGRHGLPCGLHADWNDCLRLGAAGESVFVAFQLRLGLREYATLAARLAQPAEAAWAHAQLAELDTNLERHAWDGEWYLRGYREDGFKFGSRDSAEGRIFMNPQVWAVLSGHATGERGRQVMRALHEHLATDYGIMLCAPPYVSTDPQIALARLFNPGMKENGAIFNHTQGWAVLAAAELGLCETAWEYLRNIMPARFNELAEVRQVEPYVVCQSTHSRFSPRFGAGRVSWLSGSAVWNYYAMTHAILGIKPDYDGLCLDPCLPQAWPGYRAVRRFRGCEFELEVVNGPTGKGLASLRLNGRELPGNLLPADQFQPRNTVAATLR